MSYDHSQQKEHLCRVAFQGTLSHICIHKRIKAIPEAERQRATGPKDTIGTILSQGPTFMMDKGKETSSSYQQSGPLVSSVSLVDYL
ncbi:unnamed protein product [Macrosiphum euphorbiae]|uniref:Uncharacterized protein n=1 Tax=Macrosiphum euphorbiae TaxID=13131 RepID=A0AAV0WH51_9HEMI|nr:unnamed protein product [Macrosiphum euphorbiae]